LGLSLPPPFKDDMSKKCLLLELSVVLIVLVIPLIVSSSIGYQEISPSKYWIAHLARSTSGITLILFLLRRNNEPVRSIGLVKPNRSSPFHILCLFFFIVLLRFAVLAFVCPRTEVFHRLMEMIPEDLLGLVGFLIAVVASTIFEEILDRGYILTRTEQITGNRVVAVIVSSIIFASYHSYQGGNVILIFMTGIAFGWYFLRCSRNLWNLIGAHLMLNLVVVIPSLKTWRHL